METQPLINPPETAQRLGVSLQTLANWRYRGEGPRYFRVGKAVRYSPADLETWLEDRHVIPRQGNEGEMADA